MTLSAVWRSNRVYIVLLIILVGLSVLLRSVMGGPSFIRSTLSGLTLGALYFMVAAGLTLVLGLMDVLNFAHGSIFMLGAYSGWQFYTNPTFLFGLAPLVLAFLTGLIALQVLHPLIIGLRVAASWQRPLEIFLVLAALVLAVVALLGFDFLSLADTALVSTMTGGNPLVEATPQEPLAIFWYRPLLLFLAGLLLAVVQGKPGDRTQVIRSGAVRRGWVSLAALAIVTLIAVLVRESGPIGVLKLNANLRFLLALMTGALIGAGLGAVIEITVIRPLYVRPFFQVLATLGLAYVFLELVQLLWDPLPYQMDRPPLFSQPGKASSLLTWFSGQNTTVDIFGVTFPSYRLFIIFLGIVMIVLLGLLMKYSRFGMIIRAGVQDREMVEALGINVRKVFTQVFVLGAGLAALGGIGAAPFMPVEPPMGDRFLMIGFITVVIGGMGSFSGAAVGAFLIGLARAFGDSLALKFSLTPAVSEASTVIIMAIVLLVRPAGLFGKKE
jgi:branched-chain amino acid transport system permease protein